MGRAVFSDGLRDLVFLRPAPLSNQTPPTISFLFLVHFNNAIALNGQFNQNYTIVQSGQSEQCDYSDGNDQLDQSLLKGPNYYTSRCF